MNWWRGACKICRGICYFGIWVYFMIVGSCVYSLTNSGFLMGATIFIINLLFWHAMSYIQNKTDAVYEEMKKKETLQQIQDDCSWNAVSTMIRDYLIEEIRRKPGYTIIALNYKTWYINRMREIGLGVNIYGEYR